MLYALQTVRCSFHPQWPNRQEGDAVDATNILTTPDTPLSPSSAVTLPSLAYVYRLQRTDPPFVASSPNPANTTLATTCAPSRTVPPVAEEIFSFSGDKRHCVLESATLLPMQHR